MDSTHIKLWAEGKRSTLRAARQTVTDSGLNSSAVFLRCCSGDCQHAEHEQVCTQTLRHTSAVSGLHLSSALCREHIPQREEKRKSNKSKQGNIKQRRMRRFKDTSVSQSKKENPVIIYSTSCCSKPVWISFFCGTQKHTFSRMF